jgi:ribulose-phosphate 3-epimerase
VNLRSELGLHYEIEVDGGINAETAPLCIEAGVDVLVAGSAVFGKDDYTKAIDSLRG